MKRAALIAVAAALVLTGTALLPLSTAQLRPGEATAAECTWKRQVKRVELANRGEDPHNLNLREEGGEGAPHEIPETDSLQRNVSTFDLPAGNYRLWCSLPEHEERGMSTTLLVE